MKEKEDFLFNPSARLPQRVKRCTKCGRLFTCSESWVNDKNLEDWEKRIRKNPSLRSDPSQPLLCRLRRTCLCDKCRRGGVDCNTKYVNEKKEERDWNKKK